MTAAIEDCRHCGARVVFGEDQACPACGASRLATPPTASDAAEESVWQHMQRTLSQPDPHRGVARLVEAEQPYLEPRAAAVAALQAGATADSALAERIRSQLLPEFDAVIDLLDLQGKAIKAKREEFLHERRESWRHLASAIGDNDAAQLARHESTWNTSTAALDRALAEEAGNVRIAPYQLAKAFEQALRVVTPHVFVTPALVAVNVAAYLVMVASGVHWMTPTPDDLWAWGGNFAPDTLNGQWGRLLTATFLHAGLLHLAFNMWALWALGRLVERLVGNVGFAILYFVSGLAGSIASSAVHSNLVGVGASGAVFGVAGALLGILALRRDTVPPVVLLHLRNSMLVFLGYNVLYGLQSEGVDFAAHAGGFVAGLVCGLALSQPLSTAMRPRRKWRNAAVTGVSLALLPLAARALPAPPVNESAQWNEFAETEERLIARSDEILAAGERGSLSADEAATFMEHDVLVPWRQMQEKLTAFAAPIVEDRERAAKFFEYLAARGDAWELQIEAWREDDDQKSQKAGERWTQADALAGQLAAPE